MRYYFLAILLTFVVSVDAQNICATNETYTIQYKSGLDYKTRDYIAEYQPEATVSATFAKNYHQTDTTSMIEELRFMRLVKFAEKEDQPNLEFIVDIGDVFDLYEEHGITYYVFWHKEYEAYTILGYSDYDKALTSVRTLMVKLKVGYECLCNIKPK